MKNGDCPYNYIVMFDITGGLIGMIFQGTSRGNMREHVTSGSSQSPTKLWPS